MQSEKIVSSFRDPGGFIFTKNGQIYRQINKSYQKNYDQAVKKGLFERLISEKLLIPHQEVDLKFKLTNEAYKIIKPEKVKIISYPYEWCFSQLKDAALTTLKIQKIALEKGLSLKDASNYNIQFVDGRPILIDTLSFKIYKEGQPWVAYKQFCQHFLAPLALMSYVDVQLSKLLEIYLDGIPLSLAVKLLPLRSKLNLSLLIHLHLHSSTQKKYADKPVKIHSTNKNFSKRSFLGLIDNLESGIKSLKWAPKGTEWADYYPANNNYVEGALKAKVELVADFLKAAKPTSLLDVGGNTGLFSRLASDKDIPTISFDIDPAAVEINYQEMIAKNEKTILPLILDLTNPSPAIGWKNQERSAFLQRSSADTVLALAIIHHLAISNNLPLETLAEFFASLCENLIIEFIPKSDSQVKKLLSTREDIFGNYSQEGFEKEFTKFFKIKKSADIKGSKRILYLLIRNRNGKNES